MYNYFYRCHRSYLVNLNYIRHISGNATGYKLHLEGVNDLIPVSRNLNNEIIEKINSRIESSLIKGA
jgi:DNA-binding LytR/AlgR family response regulator